MLGGMEVVGGLGGTIGTIGTAACLDSATHSYFTEPAAVDTGEVAGSAEPTAPAPATAQIAAAPLRRWDRLNTFYNNLPTNAASSTPAATSAGGSLEKGAGATSSPACDAASPLPLTLPLLAPVGVAPSGPLVVPAPLPASIRTLVPSYIHTGPLANHSFVVYEELSAGEGAWPLVSPSSSSDPNQVPLLLGDAAALLHVLERVAQLRANSPYVVPEHLLRSTRQQVLCLCSSMSLLLVAFLESTARPLPHSLHREHHPSSHLLNLANRCRMFTHNE